MSWDIFDGKRHFTNEEIVAAVREYGDAQLALIRKYEEDSEEDEELGEKAQFASLFRHSYCSREDGSGLFEPCEFHKREYDAEERLRLMSIYVSNPDWKWKNER